MKRIDLSMMVFIFHHVFGSRIAHIPKDMLLVWNGWLFEVFFVYFENYDAKKKTIVDGGK